MSTVERGQINGASTGYDGVAVFKLTNGEVWQQSRHVYKYQYAYRPMVRLFVQGGQQMLEIDGMGLAVPVVRVQIVVEGPIVSEFRGFNSDVTFEFQNGQVWVPAEYKYKYHYAYRPNAMVVSGPGGNCLHVEGMRGTLRVRRTK